MVKYRLNSAEYDNAVKEALKQIRSLKPVFNGIANEFYKTNNAIFKLQSSGKYPDFKGKRGSDGMTAYQRKKDAEVGGRGYPLLRYSGRLQASLVFRKSSDAIERLTDKSLVIGTKVEYGVYHQQPKGRGKGIIPFRPFLFLDPSTTALAPDDSLSRRSEAWVRAINKYVERKLASLGKMTGGKE